MPRPPAKRAPASPTSSGSSSEDEEAPAAAKKGSMFAKPVATPNGKARVKYKHKCSAYLLRIFGALGSVGVGYERYYACGGDPLGLLGKDLNSATGPGCECSPLSCHAYSYSSFVFAVLFLFFLLKMLNGSLEVGPDELKLSPGCRSSMAVKWGDIAAVRPLKARMGCRIKRSFIGIAFKPGAPESALSKSWKKTYGVDLIIMGFALGMTDAKFIEACHDFMIENDPGYVPPVFDTDEIIPPAAASKNSAAVKSGGEGDDSDSSGESSADEEAPAVSKAKATPSPSRRKSEGTNEAEKRLSKEPLLAGAAGRRVSRKSAPAVSRKTKESPSKTKAPSGGSKDSGPSKSTKVKSSSRSSKSRGSKSKSKGKVDFAGAME